MHLVNSLWLKRGNLKVQHLNGKLKVKNLSSNNGFLILPRIFKNNGEKYNLIFEGKLIIGNAPTIKIVNKSKEIKAEVNLNTSNILEYDNLSIYIMVIYVPGGSEFEVSKIVYNNNISAVSKKILDHFDGDTLLVTPGYPSDSNKYNTAFVHTRAKEYIANGVSLDVVVINSLPGLSIYKFGGIPVVKADYMFLRELLMKKHYKRILIHFFDENYGNVLDAVDITHTNVYLYLHGADVLYRDFPKYASRYFEKDIDITNRKNEFKRKDYYFKKYNGLSNVKWIFVSDFVRKRAEELLDIKFCNYEIIPCYIDNNVFPYKEKDVELRKKIFVLRKFSNDRCYAIDIDVRIILELSHRDFFKDLVFDIYGSGEMFNLLTAPLNDFDNVHLHQTFLTHEEIKKVHDTHGIGLFASRYDTQGVSLGEAVSSGCAIVTSNIPVITNYIDKSLGVTCEVENPIEYADVIEKMYYDATYFKKVSEKASSSVQEKFGFDKTIKKEIEMFRTDKIQEFKIKDNTKKPILSVIIPAYNVEKYLWNGVMTLINVKNANKLEILVINDGSTDSTLDVALGLDKMINNPSIFRVINKENGGHGSTINRGIKEARGKYIKIVDGDDTVDSLQFEKLIDILENEDTDIILNDYMEDIALENKLNYKCIYFFMKEGYQYNFDELCYDGYGFDEWGPILSCSTYKAEMLRNANFKLSEKCFYVDMELNTYISIACSTIKYYPMYVYRYLQGRPNQSITKKSYMKNYKNHEHVTLRIINILYENKEKITPVRERYITNKLILKMVIAQYNIVINYLKSGKAFREFEREFKKYPEFYNNPKIATKAIRLHRMTHGFLVWMNPVLLKMRNIVKRVS